MWKSKNAYWTNVSYLENIPTRNQLKKQFRKHRNSALATVEYLYMTGWLKWEDYDPLIKSITWAKNINEIDTLLRGKKIKIKNESQLKKALGNHNNSIERIKSMWINLDNDSKIISPDVINEKRLSVKEDRLVLKILRLITKWI